MCWARIILAQSASSTNQSCAADHSKSFFNSKSFFSIGQLRRFPGGKTSVRSSRKRSLRLGERASDLGVSAHERIPVAPGDGRLGPRFANSGSRAYCKINCESVPKARSNRSMVTRFPAMRARAAARSCRRARRRRYVRGHSLRPSVVRDR